MANRHEIRLCGFGGQGIILAGFIVGQAAAVYEGKYSVFIQDYGPEARGGSCRADIVISDEPILYPYIDKPTILVAMSQAAYDKYFPQIRNDTIVAIDEDLVVPGDTEDKELLLMPARRIAEGLGRVAVANSAMIGYMTGKVGIISIDSMKQSIASSVPQNTDVLNLKAFEEGYNYAIGQGA